MKYAEKSRLRIRPFSYEEGSKAFLQGAHRHWRGCVDNQGFLNRLGKQRLAIDVAILARRLSRSHSYVY
jgi:hypothetical protein